jgi:hypothetical protein
MELSDLARSDLELSDLELSDLELSDLELSDPALSGPALNWRKIFIEARLRATSAETPPVALIKI